MEDQLISLETAKLAKEKKFNLSVKQRWSIVENVDLACYAANCGRGDCSVEIWENIIKNIKNGLNTKS